jgi:hypothetical protein
VEPVVHQSESVNIIRLLEFYSEWTILNVPNFDNPFWCQNASYQLWFFAILNPVVISCCIFYVTFSTLQHEYMAKNRRTFRTS